MQKTDIISVFGSFANLAKVLGTSPTAIHKWPDVLPRRLEDRVIAAAVRAGSQEKLVAVLALLTPMDGTVEDDPEDEPTVSADEPTESSVSTGPDAIDALVEADDARDPVKSTLLSRT
ncbi:MAG: helix-turn-helix domain-containing protein [Sulfobacillus sp.]